MAIAQALCSREDGEMRIPSVLVLVLVAACGPTQMNSSTDAVDGSEDHGSSVGSGSGSNSGSGSHVPVVDTIACQTFTRSTVTNSVRVVTDQRYALVTLDPTSDWILEMCDYTTTTTNNGVTTTTNYSIPQWTPCPSESTCTDSGTPLPRHSTDVAGRAVTAFSITNFTFTAERNRPHMTLAAT